MLSAINKTKRLLGLVENSIEVYGRKQHQSLIQNRLMLDTSVMMNMIQFLRAKDCSYTCHSLSDWCYPVYTIQSFFLSWQRDDETFIHAIISFLQRCMVRSAYEAQYLMGIWDRWMCHVGHFCLLLQSSANSKHTFRSQSSKLKAFTSPCLWWKLKLLN